MTSANMLARVRTLLDEASASYWTDAECYSALSDGQREVVNIIYQRDRQSQILKTLWLELSDDNVSNQDIAVPDDFKEFINATMSTTLGGTKYTCKIVDYNPAYLRDQENTYLVASARNPSVYIKSSTTLGRLICFEPSSSDSRYTIIYMTQPTEISASVQPLLPADAQEAIIIYAFSFLLRKDERPEADTVYKIFLDMVGKL